MTPQPLLEVTRGKIVESVQHGSIAVVDSNGKLISSYGDPQTVAFLHSSAEGYQLIGLLPGVLGSDSPGIGIALKVSDGDAARMASDLTHSPRVRPAAALEILHQLGALSSKQEQALASFGPVNLIKNHRGMVTGQSRPVFEL